MRITGGKARSIPIKCPKGSVVRPATDRMRESVFSSLGSLVEDAQVLDLFAGAGSYTLEAISRGAKSGLMVERDRLALQSIKQNLLSVQKSMGGNQSRLFKVQSMDVFKWLQLQKASSSQFDLVFIDPPYKEVESKGYQLLEDLVPCLNQQDSSFVVFESPQLLERFPQGYECIKIYGKGREDARCMLLKWLPV